MRDINLTPNPKKTLVILLGMSGFFIVISTLVWYLPRKFQFDIGRFYDLFYIDKESNFPSLFSLLMFLSCAILIWVIAILTKQKNEKKYRLWYGLAFGFFVMFLDDFVMLHEKLMRPLNKVWRINRISDFLNFSWVVIGIILVVVVAIIYLKFIVELPPSTRRVFLIAALIFLSGTIGMEMVGGYMMKNFSETSREYILSTAIEETLELSGISVFIYGLLDYILTEFGQIRLSVWKNQKSS